MKHAYAYALLAVVFWTTGPVDAKAALMAERGPARLTPLQAAFWPISLGWVALLAVSLVGGRLGRLADISARGWIVLRESFGQVFGQGASLIALGNAVALWPTRRRPMGA